VGCLHAMVHKLTCKRDYQTQKWDDVMHEVMQTPSTPKTIFLKDYAQPAYWVRQVFLEFVLESQATLVTSKLLIERNGAHQQPLVLDGEDVTLLGVQRDGCKLSPQEYQRTACALILDIPGQTAELEIVTQINPSANTQLMGLYLSAGVFCTQCEAEGFRRITYMLDRPDVMARYHVTIRARKADYPVLLSNGNPVSSQDLPQGWHEAIWEDPHPKPSYLFALVAGDLHAYQGQHTAADGRDIMLNIWVAKEDLDRCAHAMAALKLAMAWDERCFGRVYDLDVFNIVAVSDFNFGAMENKGLNIFNSRYVLAKPQTATDMDFDAIEAVVAHEYFHNWTGNRVTCRDWFQLSLKEGLTVYRDQEFSADMGSRALKRIEDVRALRAFQFPEDAGPLAHPIRPESYVEISNFYTATVYNKGAEVIRMLATLLGQAGFRAGMDVYFARHDGQAVTCEAFIQAMEAGSGIDLTQFRRWYAQPGTPHVHFTLIQEHDAARVTLIFYQNIPTQPQPAEPLVIPIQLALYNAASGAVEVPSHVITLNQHEQRICFEGISARVVPSILQGFSAPVVLKSTLDQKDLAFLSQYDQDPFNRYEALQRLSLDILLELVGTYQRTPDSLAAVVLAPVLVQAFQAQLTTAGLDPALVAEALLLPSESYIGDQMPFVAVEAIHQARQALRRALAQALAPLWQQCYTQLTDDPYVFSKDAKARRRLKNTALAYLMLLETSEVTALAKTQFVQADNMTDQMAALNVLVSSQQAEARNFALQQFYYKWHQEALVLDKWFSVQALSTHPEAYYDVVKLSQHRDFTLKNPNRVRALIGAFSNNQAQFHRSDGAGYRFLAEHIIALDRLNPQTAARLVAPLGRWKRFETQRAQQMQAALEQILAQKELSKDVYEMAAKSLRG
jgi:aminopeptidase N